MDATPPPIPRHRADEPPPKKKSSALKIVLIVLACLVGGVLLLLGLGAVFLWLEKELPVTEADKEVLLTASVLGEFIEDFQVQAEGETFRKIKDIDGSHGLEYSYEDEGLHIYGHVRLERSLSDAKTMYVIEREAEELSIDLIDLEMSVRNDLLRFGDDSQAALLTWDGEPNGNFFCCRKGKHVFCAGWSGLAIEDAEMFEQAVKPVLLRWMRWQP